MKLFIAADHAGFELKQKLIGVLGLKYDVEDVGDTQFDPEDDYPQYAYRATAKVLGEPGSRAILICGSGQGMCIAANRVPGIRAALCWNKETAHETREDNDSNVLCLPARMISFDDAKVIVDEWMTTLFSGAARHKRRIQEIDDLR